MARPGATEVARIDAPMRSWDTPHERSIAAFRPAPSPEPPMSAFVHPA